jgi:hypothetical protein
MYTLLKRLVATAIFVLVCCRFGFSAPPAPVPPMGWSTWDAYGLSIDEAEFKANASVLAGLRQYGWQYVLMDWGWFMANPSAKPLVPRSVEARKDTWNAHGILIPAENRFPSSAGNAGFKPLADWVHGHGLKFGIHIVHGIPRQVVNENLPIEGSGFRAADAADTSVTCPWDQGNYGIRDNEAGQAYYDSMIGLYASWGIDYLKVDCISTHPYRPTEIRQIAEAIRKTGRPIVLSLSPGPMQLDYADTATKYAQMWRVSNDHWDAWSFPLRPNGEEFPFGLRDVFDRLAMWAHYKRPGNWPDADMLPWGSLAPHPGLGDPRESHLTQDEERMELTLWSIAQSPLILGANLTMLDEFTRSLITNREILNINQTAVESLPCTLSDSGDHDKPERCWYARTGGPHSKQYLAVFNLSDHTTTSTTSWTLFHLTDKPHAVYDVWNRKHQARSQALKVELPPHGCALFRVE